MPEACSVYDARNLLHFSDKGFRIADHPSFLKKIDNVFLVNSDVAVLHVLCLTIDHQHGSDQYDGYGELEHNPPFPRPGLTHRDIEFSFQNGHRVEPREVKGGIAPGKNTRLDGDAKDSKDHRRIKLKPQMLAGKQAE